MMDLPLGTIEIDYKPVTVTLPDGTNISSIKTVILLEPIQLPPQARIASVFEQLTKGVLVSIG